MKLKRILYILSVILMAGMAALFLHVHWYFFGFLMTLMSFTGLVLYVEMVDSEKEHPSKAKRSRRAAYFNSLTNSQKEEYLDRIEKEIKEQLKK
jgi:hypothetical protein